MLCRNIAITLMMGRVDTGAALLSAGEPFLLKFFSYFVYDLKRADWMVEYTASSSSLLSSSRLMKVSSSLGTILEY